MPRPRTSVGAARDAPPRRPKTSTARRRSRSPTANRRRRKAKPRGEPPKVVNLGGRVHVVLPKRADAEKAPLLNYYGAGCQCSGPRPCSCRGPADLQRQDPAWRGDFCNRSYSLEELTRLSYAYEDIMLERTFATERLYLRERGRSGGRLKECWTPKPKKRPPVQLPKGPHITYQNGCPVVVDYDANRFTGTDHNHTPAYLKAVNSGRRVRFADEVCGALGTELDRTTYQDSFRLPDYAPPSIPTKCGLHSQDLNVRRPQDLASVRATSLYPNPLMDRGLTATASRWT